MRAPWCLIALVSAIQQPETYHTRPHPRARHRGTSLHVGGWSVAISWASVGVVACAVVSACLSICQGALSWSACRHASTAISQMRCTCCNTAVKALARTIRGALVHPESGFVFRPPKLGQKFLDFLQNKLRKSDFLTGRKNSILIPTRNADGMWASIMSLQEQGFCEIRNSDNCGRRRGGRTLPRSWPRMSTTKPRMC